MPDASSEAPTPEEYPSDRGPRSHGKGPLRWWLAQYREFVAALRFLSILPAPGGAQLFSTEASEAQLIIGSALFPIVGILIALVLVLLVAVLRWLLPSLVLAGLLVVAIIVLTGGLHLDGLMDTCDGLFGGRDRERKLSIMRDSRVGSFGVLGGVSIILLKFVVLASLNVSLLPLAFLLVMPVSRWSMVLAIYCFPSARATGLGAAVRQTVTSSRLVFAGVSAFLFAILIGHLLGLCIWLVSVMVPLSIGWLVTRELGGLTGDIYGAIAEVTEVVCLFTFLVLQHRL